jgi:hypothetical protein
VTTKAPGELRVCVMDDGRRVEVWMPGDERPTVVVAPARMSDKDARERLARVFTDLAEWIRRREV